MDKSVKLSDCLVVLAVVLPMAALVGATLGFSANRFGLPSSIRVAIMVVFCGLASHLSRQIIARRMKARSTPPPQGLK